MIAQWYLITSGKTLFRDCLQGTSLVSDVTIACKKTTKALDFLLLPVSANSASCHTLSWHHKMGAFAMCMVA